MKKKIILCSYQFTSTEQCWFFSIREKDEQKKGTEIVCLPDLSGNRGEI